MPRFRDKVAVNLNNLLQSVYTPENIDMLDPQLRSTESYTAMWVKLAEKNLDWVEANKPEELETPDIDPYDAE